MFFFAISSILLAIPTCHFLWVVCRQSGADNKQSVVSSTVAMETNMADNVTAKTIIRLTCISSVNVCYLKQVTINNNNMTSVPSIFLWVVNMPSGADNKQSVVSSVVVIVTNMADNVTTMSIKQSFA